MGRAAAPARDAGVRVVYPRLGLVMHPDGGVLAKLLPVFNVGGGGKVGSGAQWMSWIGMRDTVRALVFLMVTDAMHGSGERLQPESRDERAVLADVRRRVASSGDRDACRSLP